ncbi:WD40 repeat domain-containing protein [Nostoc sp. DSM 114159]|jgi:WD40 repeat protein
MSLDFHCLFKSHSFISLDRQSSYAISPDGRFLFAGGLEDRTVRVWDLQTGQIVRTWMVAALHGHHDVDRVYCLDVSSDSKILVTGGSLIQAWNLDSGQKIRTFKGGGWATRMSLSPDMSILVTEFDKLVFWDFQTGKNKCKLPASICGPLVINSDSQYLVSADYSLNKTRTKGAWEYQIKVWDLRTGQVTRTLESKGIETTIHGLVLSPNEQLLAGSKIDAILIWDFQTGQQIQKIDKFKNVRLHKHLDTVYSLIFSPDGKVLLSTGTDGLIQAWDVSTGKHIGTIQGQNFIFTIFMSNDAQTLVGIGGSGNHKTAEVWRMT